MATEQTHKLITVTAKAAEKIHEYISQEQKNLNSSESTSKVADALVSHMGWDLKKQQKKMI